MSDLTLHTVTKLQVAARSTGQAIAARAQRAAERFTREQTGQDVLEYTGLIVFVAAAIVLLFTLQIPQKVSAALASAMNSVFSQGHSQYTAPVITAKP
jgi:Flp pilus assembly pilin Flp